MISLIFSQAKQKISKEHNLAIHKLTLAPSVDWLKSIIYWEISKMIT